MDFAVCEPECSIVDQEDMKYDEYNDTVYKM